MIKPNRLSQLSLETPDVSRQVEYYTQVLGLSVAVEDKNAVYLSTKNGRHALVLTKGDAPRSTSTGFQVEFSNGIEAATKFLQERGVAAERRSDPHPGIAESLLLRDPEGQAIELFQSSGLLDGDPTPGAFALEKLGHVAFNVLDIDRTIKFYTETLGFKFADSRADYFIFLRCGRDHHTINFWEHATTTKMHHFAFELKSAADIMRACDFLAQHDYRIFWGPGRHVIGHNIFTYHKNPDGHTIELYADMDQIASPDEEFYDPRPWHQDRPQLPKRWPVETLGNYWGGTVPEGFGE